MLADNLLSPELTGGVPTKLPAPIVSRTIVCFVEQGTGCINNAGLSIFFGAVPWPTCGCAGNAVSNDITQPGLGAFSPLGNLKRKLNKKIQYFVLFIKPAEKQKQKFEKKNPKQ